MTAAEYKALLKRMASLEAIASTFGRRKEAEQNYYNYHKGRGVKLKEKYRL